MHNTVVNDNDNKLVTNKPSIIYYLLFIIYYLLLFIIYYLLFIIYY